MKPRFIALHIKQNECLRGPLIKEWHVRGNQAWIIEDVLTETLLLAQKLPIAAAYLNQNARTEWESVSTRSLYEAATSKMEGKQVGPHKLRYLVDKCDLDRAHITFESAREGTKQAIVLKELR